MWAQWFLITHNFLNSVMLYYAHIFPTRGESWFYVSYWYQAANCSNHKLPVLACPTSCFEAHFTRPKSVPSLQHRSYSASVFWCTLIEESTFLPLSPLVLLVSSQPHLPEGKAGTAWETSERRKLCNSFLVVINSTPLSTALDFVLFLCISGFALKKKLSNLIQSIAKQ